jgi:hypothetical protein
MRQFAEYGHRKGRVAKHTCCAGGTWYVQLEPQEMHKTLGERERERERKGGRDGREERERERL